MSIMGKTFKVMGTILFGSMILAGCGAEPQKVEQIMVMECKECKEVGEEQVEEKKVKAGIKIEELKIGNGVGYCNNCWNEKVDKTVKDLEKKAEAKKKDEIKKKEEAEAKKKKEADEKKKQEAEEKKKEEEAKRGQALYTCALCGGFEPSGNLEGPLHGYVAYGHSSCVKKARCIDCKNIIGVLVEKGPVDDGRCSECYDEHFANDVQVDDKQVSMKCISCGFEVVASEKLIGGVCYTCGEGPMKEN